MAPKRKSTDTKAAPAKKGQKPEKSEQEQQPAAKKAKAGALCVGDAVPADYALTREDDTPVVLGVSRLQGAGGQAGSDEVRQATARSAALYKFSVGHCFRSHKLGNGEVEKQGRRPAKRSTTLAVPPRCRTW